MRILSFVRLRQIGSINAANLPRKILMEMQEFSLEHI